MRVLVIGDIRLFRDGLAHYLRRVPNVTVVGVAKERTSAVSQCRELQPDVALVDMAMPEGMLAVREIGDIGAGIRVVALSIPDDGGAVIACAEVGVSAYVARDGSLDDLVSTLYDVMRGEAQVSPRIAGALLRRLGDVASGRCAPTSSSPLTPREEEIASLVADGLSNKQIARRLRIRVPTVKNHVHNILEKLNASRRMEIARRRGQAGQRLGPSALEWSRNESGPPETVQDGSRSNAGSGVDPGDHSPTARPGKVFVEGRH